MTEQALNDVLWYPRVDQAGPERLPELVKVTRTALRVTSRTVSMRSATARTWLTIATNRPPLAWSSSAESASSNAFASREPKPSSGKRASSWVPERGAISTSASASDRLARNVSPPDSVRVGLALFVERSTISKSEAKPYGERGAVAHTDAADAVRDADVLITGLDSGTKQEVPA